MNRKCLLVLSVLGGAWMTSLVHAQNVQVYGRAHASFEHIKQGGRAAVRHNEVKNNVTRVGFRGVEDLGEGLKAIWQIESSAPIDTGGGTFASRESFVGLTGRLGTIRYENFFSAYDDMHYIAGNSFQFLTGSSNDATLWANGGNIAVGGFDPRNPNSVSYLTPNIRGWTSRIQYSLTGGAGSSEELGDDGAYVVSANIKYDQGPWRIGFAHAQNRRMQVTSAGFYEDGYANMLAVAYDFGSIYLAGLIERIDLENINRTGNDRDRFYWSVIGRYTYGPHIFSALYGDADDFKGNAGISDSGAQMYSIAYNYVFSKRTQAYLIYTRLENDRNAAYILGRDPVRAAVAGADWTPGAERQDGILLGMWHNF